MATLLTPGLYRQPARPIRAIGPLARGDVPVFLGYAERGPVGAAVRIESLENFEDLFGTALAHGFLWHAVKGFFETGGLAAYVIRLAGDDASVASAAVGSWMALSSFPWPMIDPRRLRGADRAAAATWLQTFEAQIRNGGARSADPGVWANTYSIVIRRDPLMLVDTVPDSALPPTVLAVASTAGLETPSILELTQTQPDGDVVSLISAIDELDHVRRQIHLPAALPASFDALRPIALESVEFQVEIINAGKLEQQFEHLALHPDHSQTLEGTLARECRALSLEAPENPDWTDPASWPAEGVFSLSGGTDGLTSVNVNTYLSALPAIARLNEVALIAAPDLVLPDTQPAPLDDAPIDDPVDCANLDPPREGRLFGVVTTGDLPDDPGSGRPLVGVDVDIAGLGGRATTDADGWFAVEGIDLGLVTVRLTRAGYEPLEALAQSSSLATPDPAFFELQPLTTPRSLGETEVIEVAKALGNPALTGPYKIAVIDPPSATARLDDLRAWRAQLGDNQRLAFFGPWLKLPSTDATGRGGFLAYPPSGHVCGAIAAAETATGIHRTGANLPLRYVEGVTLDIDDALQAVLNHEAVNAIRIFPGRGIRVFGSRTISSDPAWRYVTTRRIVDAIEKTLERRLAWLVFEPNSLMTRQAAHVAVSTFLARLWRDGVLAGDSPEAAFTVKVDEENNPAATRDAGQFIIEIGVAPTQPFEFVIFRLGKTRDAITVTERL